MKPATHFFFITLLLILLTALMLKPRTYFASDTGLRAIQIHNIAKNQRWTSAEIPYPNEQIDPEYKYVPYYVAYLIHNEGLYFNISPIFPLITAVFLANFGWYGMIIPLIVGAIMIAWATYILAKQFDLKLPFLWIWLSVFGTPVIFYTVQIWDHSLAVGFTTMGVALTAVSLQSFATKKMLLGGVFLSLAFAQRPEAIPFAIAAGLALGLTHYQSIKRLWPFLIGGLSGTAVSALINIIWQGTIWGFPFGSNLFKIGVPTIYPAMALIKSTRPPSTEAIKIGRLLLHINARDPLTFSAAIMILIAILLIFFGFRIPNYQKKGVLFGGLGFITISFLLLIGTSFQQPVLGLISTAPFLPLSLAFVNRPSNGQIETTNSTTSHAIYSFIFTTALFFVLLMLLVWPTFGGRQWGARYLLPSYPLFVILAGYSVTNYQQNFKRPLSQTIQHLTIGIAIISFIFQAAGLTLLYRKLEFDRDLLHTIQALEAEVIFTNEPFLQASLGPLEDKQFFYVTDSAQISNLIPAVFENNVRQVGVIPRDGSTLTISEKIDEIDIFSTGAVTYALSASE